jgi:GNAT superfamily N-acetyltransferase
MREEHRAGLQYLAAVTTLAQRVRASHPTAGQFEAADWQWSWRKPGATDELPQLFWFNEDGRPEAAAVMNEWGDSILLDPIVMPDASPDWIAHVVERGLAQATEIGIDNVEFVIDSSDSVMIDVLAVHGFTAREDELVESWLDAAARPAISALDQGYRLADRAATQSHQHHMIGRGGPDIEKRLRQTSLYRPDLDLVVLDGEGTPAAYGLFWFDPVTATGLVEPMRTEDAHQRRGLARHVLTSGVDRLAKAGANRIKICFDNENQGAKHLYLSVGFKPVKQCAAVTRPG